MAFICRVIPDGEAEEPDELRPKILADEVVDGVRWHLVEFEVDDKHSPKGVRTQRRGALQWIRGEMSTHYDLIGFVDKVKMQEYYVCRSLVALIPKEKMHGNHGMRKSKAKAKIKVEARTDAMDGVSKDVMMVTRVPDGVFKPCKASVKVLKAKYSEPEESVYGSREV